MPENFPAFFSRAFFDARQPYAFQTRLACGVKANSSAPESLTHGTACASRLIDIPTGLGKTAAVVLAWLWNRVAHSDPAAHAKWPRRLVYCLPMRTLVEQTHDETGRWLKNLGLDEQVGLHLLMGGEDAGEWDIHPERAAILIGTQDMLLSRALNRGYGMSRYRWPIHFGLLNNDCLWVMDETQLMGPGLGTACQLEAFRNPAPQGFESFGGNGSVTWYLSATSNLDLLKTRDWRDVPRSEEFVFGLTDEEKAATDGDIPRRRNAAKRLELKSGSHFGDITAAGAPVSSILAEHRHMLEAIGNDTDLPARTLIICNTVDRAMAVHQQLATEKPDGCDLLLLHSRFRPVERSAQMERLGSVDRTAFPKGQIVVATQVIEAGVDVSSGILWSEVAPLASLVQRLGRLNRAGEFNESNWQPLAVIVGIGLENAPQRENKEAKEKRERENAKRCLPYGLAACETAWTSLDILNANASPANLATIQPEIAASIPRCPYSLQHHELLDFFDTDANLSLGFTDVSPFVRGLDEDTDIQVLWRESWLQKDGEEGTREPGFTPDFQRDELCSVPIGKALKARDILNQGWIWRGKDAGWASVRDAGLAPGMTILLPLTAGGYDEQAGWTGNTDNNRHSSPYKPQKTKTDEDLLSYLDNGWRSIAAHTCDVGDELTSLLDVLLPKYESERSALLAAAPWHDVGKNHPDWQSAVVSALGKAGIDGKDEHKPFAKFSLSESPRLRGLTDADLRKEIARLKRLFRPGLAHEVASALAFRQAEQARLGHDRDTDLASLLAEYVIMSHHGRVRKVLRDEIPRNPKDAKDTETVRGIAGGTELPAVVINDESLGCKDLATDCRKMGRGADGHESYTRGVLRLLDHYGPFRLAYFEAVFRSADIRASIQAQQNP
ncbi:MAG: DEAD/DEAH box helicase [Chthoniobacterales bacterium]|nr:DEAD/DEAH box helicase [Chthoniobacterales bacterium]